MGGEGEELGHNGRKGGTKSRWVELGHSGRNWVIVGGPRSKWEEKGRS